MIPYDKYDEEGRKLIVSTWYLPHVIADLKSKGNCYTYYRGKKITSDMSEEEIYAMTYGSEEAFDAKYPKGYSEESLEIAKNEVLFVFLSVAPNEVAEQHIEVIKKRGKCNINFDLAEYILALANGAPCEDILVTINKNPQSGSSLAATISAIRDWSLRGKEFVEYYKSVDPERYEFYFGNTNENSAGLKH